ncbi:MAG TPA: cytochrome c-type biogenesis CcmF C-terminal domain-containing protein [Polyangia bacterium]|nr:cytochrome c-type biogenesis CcmF C-terminal domain-containing protein [Polyangia bacterium]
MHDNAVAALGQAGLLLALVVSAYTVAGAVAGARRGSRKLVASAIYASYGATALVTFSSAVMWFLILSNDYSVKYVQRHSDASMPWYYKLTAFWGGLDGSIMWWVLLLALFSSVAIWVNRERHRELIPYVTAVLFTVISFFLLLIIFEKRPFDIFLTDAPHSGKGLNPLLQNPYMATHPPSLYLGFVSATVPFAFGLAALITGNLDDSWITSTRRWVIVSWYFLSQGLVLGSLWAYEELGWGGYWGWDPVENAGFLPWLTSTAFLHSIMIQERRAMMKVWNVCLVITTFLLTIIGTFMTRSGIVQSVHAFGQDNELAIIFLTFIAVVAIFSFGFVIYRLPLLRSRASLDSWLSREYAFLLNNWILLSAAFFILVATLFPTLSEAVTGERITVGPPFFNQWMTPIGLMLLFLTGVGPLIAWRKASSENLKTQFAWPLTSFFAVAIALGAFTRLRGWSEWELTRWHLHLKLPLTPMVLCFALCAFTATTIVQEFYRGTRVRQTHTKLDFFTSLIGLVARGKRRYGGYLVHLAVVLMFIGFAGNGYKRESEATLTRGQSITIDRYTVRFDGLTRTADPQKEMTTAQLTVYAGGKEFAKMYPAKWSYRHHEDEPPTTEVDIKKMAKEDLYLILNGYEGGAQELANIKVVINPLVNWIWFGFLLLIIGTVVAFLPDRAYMLAGAKVKEGGDGGKAAATAGVILLFLFAGGVARAQNSEAPMQHVTGGAVYARNDNEKKIFARIVCQCGTCGRQVLSECSCGTANQMRGVIQRLLDAGKTEDDVIAYELATYPGQSALVVPLDKGFNRVAWLLPYGALLGAAGMLVVVARRWTRKPAVVPPSSEAIAAGDAKAGAAKPDASDAEYESRLDDELDELD